MIDINRKFHKRVLIVCHICVYEATDDDIVMRGSSQPAAVEPESSPLDEPESSFQRQKVIGIRRGVGDQQPRWHHSNTKPGIYRSTNQFALLASLS